MLARAKNKRRKIWGNEKDNNPLSSPPPTRRQSNLSVMGELVCCFCHETTLCPTRAYHAKRTQEWCETCFKIN